MFIFKIFFSEDMGLINSIKGFKCQQHKIKATLNCKSNYKRFQRPLATYWDHLSVVFIFLLFVPLPKF